MFEPVWEFTTEHFRVSLEFAPSEYPDLSWADEEQLDLIERGVYQVFDSRVVIYMDGREIAADYLGESVYKNPEEFYTAHRDHDPMNRNCSIMRRTKGDNVSICHYFPDMVRIAISEARQYLHNAPSIRQTA